MGKERSKTSWVIRNHQFSLNHHIPASSFYEYDVCLPSLIIGMFSHVPVMPSGQVKMVFQIVSREGDLSIGGNLRSNFGQSNLLKS